MNNTSKNLDKSLSSALEKVLFCIKRYEPIGTTDIADKLEIGNEAARLHVQKLLKMKLIVGQDELSPQLGRPKQEWIITEKGNLYFPNTHAELTVQLIESVRQLFGEEGLNQLILKREEETLNKYLQHCQADTLQEKLKKLTELRYEEGYMAHLSKNGDDYLLIEEHCPICAAAKACQNFCRSELSLFQSILGEHAKIVREEYLLEKGQRCIYRITP